MILACPVLSLGAPGEEQGVGDMSAGVADGLMNIQDEWQNSIDWVSVLEALAFSEHRQAVMAADATVCMQADGGVVEAIATIYNSVDLRHVKSRLARPIFGLRNPGALPALTRILQSRNYPPDDEIVVASARSAIRLGGEAGVLAVLRKLSTASALPDEHNLDQWNGLALMEELANNGNNKAIPELIRAIDGGGDGRNNQERLGAACALLPLIQNLERSTIKTLADGETNAIIKDCLDSIVQVLSERDGQGLRKGGSDETINIR